MPFDSLRVKQPDNVVHLPPIVREGGGGGPQRIHIEIEIVDRRAAPPKRGQRFIGWLLLLMLITMAAHAQPSSWSSHREGFMTRYSGTDAQGGMWTGKSYELSGTRYFEFNGPRGIQTLPVLQAGLHHAHRLRLSGAMQPPVCIGLPVTVIHIGDARRTVRQG